MLRTFVIYVTFEPEITNATHYLSIDDITIKAVTKDGNIASVSSEVYQFLASNYPDRKVCRMSVSER